MSKREHILDTAEMLFNAFGYTAVGVDLIRDTAEVSKTSMYRYFGSKHQLIEAVLARRHAHFKDALGAAVEAGVTREGRLEALLDWHFAWFETQAFKGCMFMHALAEFKMEHEELVEWARQHKVWLATVLASIIDPESPQINSRVESLMTLLEGMIVRAEFGLLNDDKEIYRHAAKQLAFTQ